MKICDWCWCSKCDAYMASFTTKAFFTNGIRRLAHHYTVCIEKRGDYIEKWYTLQISQIVVHEVN